MPLYEYECDSCHHRFEVIQKFSDALIDTCPKCGSTVHKLMSSPAIQFKGSGWYITDYAKKDSASAGKTGGSKDESSKTADSSTTADSGSKDSGSSDAKPSAPAATPAKTD
jgi:putative FmdB family regulatory protein